MKNYLILTLFFISFSSWAQQQDSKNYKRAIHEYNLGNYQTAIPIFKAANDFKMLAKSYHSLGDYSTAKSYYKRAIHQNKTDTLLKYNYAQFLYKTKDYKEALNTFDQLHNLDTTNANFIYYQGLLKEKEKPKEALAYFIEAYKKDKNHLNAIYKIARTYFYNTDFDHADEYLKKGTAIDSNHINLLKLSALTAFYTENYEKTIEIYHKLMEQGEEFELLHSKSAEAYLALEDFDQALDEYRVLFENYPQKSPTNWLEELGYTHRQLKDYEGSERYYQAAITQLTIPLLYEYMQLAALYREQKKYSNEIGVYRKILSINPQHEEALIELAVTADKYYADRELVLSYYDHYLKLYSESGRKREFAKDRASYLRKKIHLKKD